STSSWPSRRRIAHDWPEGSARIWSRRRWGMPDSLPSCRGLAVGTWPRAEGRNDEVAPRVAPAIMPAPPATPRPDETGPDPALPGVAARLREERAALSARIGRLREDMGVIFESSRDSNADDEHD